MAEEQEFTIKVTSEDPKAKDKPKPVDGETPAKKSEKKDELKDGDELSEEDVALKSQLELLVERLREPSPSELHLPALESLRTLIRTSTSSMTSVPKPLKFLRPHYPDLQTLHESWTAPDGKKEKSLFAEILSVLAMTYSDTQPRGTLRYRLFSQGITKVYLPGDPEYIGVVEGADTLEGEVEGNDPGEWGHEYVRHLAAELGEEYNSRIDEVVMGKRPEATATTGDPSVTSTVPITSTDPVTGATTTSDPPKKGEVDALPKKVAPPPRLPGTLGQLRTLALTCSSFLLAHNAEPDAVDLLQELDIVNKIADLVTGETWQRVGMYMSRCVELLPTPDDFTFLHTVHTIYVKFSRFPEALALAIKLNDKKLIRDDFDAPSNPLMKRQLAFILARAQIPLEWLRRSSDTDDEDEEMDDEEELPEDLVECLSNTRLSEHFRAFGKELGVVEAKSLEEVYKSHLEATRPTAPQVDSARANLAGTFVNAFVNAGFGNDKLMVEAEEGNSWIYKNKEHGMMSAAASLGLSLLWDTDIGLSHVDKYTYSAEEHIKAGALLATGLLNTGIRSEADAAEALLSEYTLNPAVPLRVAAIVGLGVAYAGSQRRGLIDLLLPHVTDENVSMEVASMSALALGMIFTGSAEGEVASGILQGIMDRESVMGLEKKESVLSEKWGKFMGLGLGLLYLGLRNSDDKDATIETLKAVEHPISKMCQVIVEVCAFAGSGEVLKIQQMLHHCDDHIEAKPEEEEKKDPEPASPSAAAADTPAAGTTGAAPAAEPAKEGEDSETKPRVDDSYQAFAVLGIALVAMGEDVGAEMSLRQFGHLMHYGSPTIRRTVPLALGLISASSPVLPILDTLSKYSHDHDLSVALNAIFAMGLVGAGTNNARLAQMLRQLAGYYYKEPDCLFMVRISQGLVHMGKGTIGINPYFGDRSIMSRTGVAGLLACLTAFTDAKAFVLDKYHWMLYFIVTAMYPRFLITLDEELNPKPISVRVGQAVDVVGQAGKPRTISGFQTHTTPVRLGTTERAELATEEWIPFANVLEGFVILQKNPGWEGEDKRQL